MTSKDNLNRIPAQRYFTQEELCQVVGISSKEFEAWQRDHGLIGYGGNHYSRLDVVKALRLKSTFAPYVGMLSPTILWMRQVSQPQILWK